MHHDKQHIRFVRGVIVNVSLALVCCAWSVDAFAGRVLTCMCLLHNNVRGAVKHGMLILRFEYAVWYLQDKEEP